MMQPASHATTLEDKYTLESGRVFVTGTQALVRLPIVQRWRDRAAGLNTAGFITGYRGSPLGGLDQALQRAKSHADAAEITFLPGVNEDLAATAILGTQQIGLHETPSKAGVFAMWYGKGPGVDRSGDAFRHGNLAGTMPHGGVLLLAGDDHTCKSSTTSHQSEYAFVDAMIPVLNPAGIQDIIDFGLAGWALSRYSSLWTGLKLIAETVDSSASIAVDVTKPHFVTPADFEFPAGGPHIRWPDTPQEQERRLHTVKLPAAAAFARTNGIDRVMMAGARRRLGIVTTGKSYLDVRQALEEIGLSAARAVELGLAIYKVGMVWPLEPEGLTAFARGLPELLIIEEKRPLIEGQVKDILYNLPADARPRVLGKQDAENRIVLPAHDDLTPVQIARAIATRILPWIEEQPLLERIARLSNVDTARLAALAPASRTYYFCSGCPHNTSTRVPDGSRAYAGIGCSWMSQSMDRATATYTHMGGEGANWIGQAPFVPTKHVFQNLGDGTYFHSGLLAIRAAVAAKVNITYKILYNDAVAMTGGQMHDGELTPQSITHQVRAEGVRRIAVVSDDIDKYRYQPAFAQGVTIHHRRDLDRVQRELRSIAGVTALVYDQTCAAEKRRRKKRGSAAAPPRLVLINELVCEGCGDCSKASNCLSVVPIDTEFGRKRAIDQSSCNQDFSCVEGFCPSFVTALGGTLRKGAGGEFVKPLLARPLPEPPARDLERPWNVLVTGVGGTGVVTIGAILAMAAHLEGKACSTLDMTGLAQKGGPVTTHLRLASDPGALNAVRIAAGGADLMLACDLVTAAGKDALSVLKRGRTRLILNVTTAITPSFVRDRDFTLPDRALRSRIEGVVGSDAVDTVAAGEIAARLLGDTIATNLFMVGYAFQKGLIPITEGAILKAVALNGAAVDMNMKAFRLGRLAAHDPKALSLAEDKTPGLEHRRQSSSLDEIIARRVAFLTDYQHAAYAGQYSQAIAKVRAREAAVTGSEGPLSDAVARNLFKLMAYKDEYEVARLYTGPAFAAQLAERFEASPRLTLHLAPPLIARRDPVTGAPRKIAFGPWIIRVFGALARLKRLRGTRFDLFGLTAERRTERALIGEYRAVIDRELASLSPERLPSAIAIARTPEQIRGFGHVKSSSVAAAREAWMRTSDFTPPAARQAAE